MGPTNCPETSVQNYHSTLLNIPEECRSQYYVRVILTRFYNVIFKIKHKLYIASGSAPPPPPPIKNVGVHQPQRRLRTFPYSNVLKQCKGHHLQKGHVQTHPKAANLFPWKEIYAQTSLKSANVFRWKGRTQHGDLINLHPPWQSETV
jgi:hypothetical protein